MIIETEALVKAAEELNEELGLDPQIKLNVPYNELVKQLQVVSKEILPSDRLTKTTREVIQNLNLETCMTKEEDPKTQTWKSNSLTQQSIPKKEGSNL